MARLCIFGFCYVRWDYFHTVCSKVVSTVKKPNERVLEGAISNEITALMAFSEAFLIHSSQKKVLSFQNLWFDNSPDLIVNVLIAKFLN